jgi:hypothetical protein
MRVFACPSCRRLVTFENSRCLNCGTELGFHWGTREIVALKPAWHRCANHEIAACNGVVESSGELCPSCRLTRTRPSDDDQESLSRLAEAEWAKRRLLFQLYELGLPVVGWHEQEGGLAFDFLTSKNEPVTTGHANGVITVDLAEADPAHREAVRLALGEPYRTLLGHLRHEIGHYYEPILAPEGSPALEKCRRLFGDERQDYDEARRRYYDQGPPDDWPQRFVSTYAAMHPWEDWAETFAHYLHIRDTLQTAAAYGVRVEGPAIPTADTMPLHSHPAHARGDMDDILDAWLPLTYALNAINRSMGAQDLYPFVITAQVADKLAFIHELVCGASWGKGS